MERAILLLISDDIRLERQHWVLGKIGWDAETILTYNLRVIGLLMNIEISDAVIEIYSKMLSRAFVLDVTKEQIENLSKEILNFLKNC